MAECVERSRSVLTEYQVLPNGLAPGPRYFTKLFKPVYSFLEELGPVCFPYIDEGFIMGNTKDECQLAVKDTMELLQKLGFTMNRGKSDLTASHTLEFWDFKINSELMLVSLTEDKIENFKATAIRLLSVNTSLIREVAALIGLMVACTPAGGLMSH